MKVDISLAMSGPLDAAPRAAELEALAVAAGGIAGPGTLGASPTPEVTP